MRRSISLTVNGRKRGAEVEPRMLLVHFVRESLGLTGTNVGCDTSQCGSCTILMDGKAVKSCTVLAVQADGAEITTIEGLENPDTGELSIVQQAVMDEGGFQCAFCAPGFIMSMTALVADNPNATREEAAQALSGNLCRCGDYHKILNCAMRAGELARSV